MFIVEWFVTGILLLLLSAPFLAAAYESVCWWITKSSKGVWKFGGEVINKLGDYKYGEYRINLYGGWTIVYVCALFIYFFAVLCLSKRADCSYSQMVVDHMYSLATHISPAVLLSLIPIGLTFVIRFAANMKLKLDKIEEKSKSVGDK